MSEPKVHGASTQATNELLNFYNALTKNENLSERQLEKRILGVFLKKSGTTFEFVEKESVSRIGISLSKLRGSGHYKYNFEDNMAHLKLLFDNFMGEYNSSKGEGITDEQLDQLEKLQEAQHKIIDHVSGKRPKKDYEELKSNIDFEKIRQKRADKIKTEVEQVKRELEGLKVGLNKLPDSEGIRAFRGQINRNISTLDKTPSPRSDDIDAYKSLIESYKGVIEIFKGEKLHSLQNSLAKAKDDLSSRIESLRDDVSTLATYEKRILQDVLNALPKEVTSENKNDVEKKVKDANVLLKETIIVQDDFRDKYTTVIMHIDSINDAVRELEAIDPQNEKLQDYQIDLDTLKKQLKPDFTIQENTPKKFERSVNKASENIGDLQAKLDEISQVISDTKELKDIQKSLAEIRETLFSRIQSLNQLAPSTLINYEKRKLQDILEDLPEKVTLENKNDVKEKVENANELLKGIVPENLKANYENLRELSSEIETQLMNLEKFNPKETAAYNEPVQELSAALKANFDEKENTPEKFERSVNEAYAARNKYEAIRDEIKGKVETAKALLSQNERIEKEVEVLQDRQTNVKEGLRQNLQDLEKQPDLPLRNYQIRKYGDALKGLDVSITRENREVMEGRVNAAHDLLNQDSVIPEHIKEQYTEITNLLEQFNSRIAQLEEFKEIKVLPTETQMKMPKNLTTEKYKKTSEDHKKRLHDESKNSTDSFERTVKEIHQQKEALSKALDEMQEKITKGHEVLIELCKEDENKVTIGLENINQNREYIMARGYKVSQHLEKDYNGAVKNNEARPKLEEKMTPGKLNNVRSKAEIFHFKEVGPLETSFKKATSALREVEGLENTIKENLSILDEHISNSKKANVPMSKHMLEEYEAMKAKYDQNMKKFHDAIDTYETGWCAEFNNKLTRLQEGMSQWEQQHVVTPFMEKIGKLQQAEHKFESPEAQRIFDEFKGFLSKLTQEREHWENATFFDMFSQQLLTEIGDKLQTPQEIAFLKRIGLDTKHLESRELEIKTKGELEKELDQLSSKLQATLKEVPENSNVAQWMRKPIEIHQNNTKKLRDEVHSAKDPAALREKVQEHLKDVTAAMKNISEQGKMKLEEEMKIQLEKTQKPIEAVSKPTVEELTVTAPRVPSAFTRIFKEVSDIVDRQGNSITDAPKDRFAPATSNSRSIIKDRHNESRMVQHQVKTLLTEVKAKHERDELEKPETMRQTALVLKDVFDLVRETKTKKVPLQNKENPELIDKIKGEAEQTHFGPNLEYLKRISIPQGTHTYFDNLGKNYLHFSENSDFFNSLNPPLDEAFSMHRQLGFVKNDLFSKIEKSDDKSYDNLDVKKYMEILVVEKGLELAIIALMKKENTIEDNFKNFLAKLEDLERTCGQAGIELDQSRKNELTKIKEAVTEEGKFFFQAKFKES